MNHAERDFRDYLDDILDNAQKLKSFVAGLSFEEFQADDTTRRSTRSCVRWKSSAKPQSVSLTNSASVTQRYPSEIWRACATLLPINMNGWTQACYTRRRHVKSML